MRFKLKLPLSQFFIGAPVSKLGDLPKEATLALTKFYGESADVPADNTALEVFKHVKAIWVEVPVAAVKAAFMGIPALAALFDTFEDYQLWYRATNHVPKYLRDNRWPCLVSTVEDEIALDGYHRLHSYIWEGHATVPFVSYDRKKLERLHEKWLEDVLALELEPA
jgi:hypothetical protein